MQRLKPAVSGPADLLRARVAVVAGTTGQLYADRAGIAARVHPTFESALKALDTREADAVIGATAILNFLVARGDDPNVVVLPKQLFRGYVALGMRLGLDPGIEKRIELELLRVEQGSEFRAYREALFGNETTDAGQGAGGGTHR